MTSDSRVTDSQTGSPIIVALDYPSLDAAAAMADRLNPAECRVKVGKELFTRCGPDVITMLRERGFDIFLDLKFHDIPNTVASAVAVAADLGVWMVNVHASGGARMMTAAREALAGYPQPPLLIAVTVLTSMERGDLQAVGIDCEPRDQVMRLATLAQQCGLDGVVCSAQEAPALKQQLGRDFSLVTPGIRPQSSDPGDQRRICTPAEAVAAGSDYLVIGRPITQSADPLETLRSINGELGSPGP